MKYSNPILYSDLSDPDVVRDGKDFYMTASTFTYVPGLPILHSRDLVHWEIIAYAALTLPHPRYRKPAHGCGIWAPSIRRHRSLFYIFACMPDEGLYCWTAEKAEGPWTCHLVKKVTGWIDPCPLFEADGTWLIHGFAASRVGINNVLYIHRLSDDGLSVLDKGRRVYDGAEHGDVTVEGPKIYRHGGLYWILCPAGGVKTGYQLALRSRNLFGPYERRIVLQQGKTPVNGPHQGAWVDDSRGGNWFIHFQDMEAYGRILHLQPVDWSDGWPVMGNRGEPVPGGDTLLPGISVPVLSEDCFSEGIGLAWQWQANPDPAWYALMKSGLRLYAAPAGRLDDAGSFLSRLMPCRDFDMDLFFTASLADHARAGVAVMGGNYSFLSLQQGSLHLCMGSAESPEKEILSVSHSGTGFVFRMQIRRGTVAFLYGCDPESLTPLGEALPMTPGGWTGARPGVFCLSDGEEPGGWIDVHRVRITEHDNESVR